MLGNILAKTLFPLICNIDFNFSMCVLPKFIQRNQLTVIDLATTFKIFKFIYVNKLVPLIFLNTHTDKTNKHSNLHLTDIRNYRTFRTFKFMRLRKSCKFIKHGPLILKKKGKQIVFTSQ